MAFKEDDFYGKIVESVIRKIIKESLSEDNKEQEEDLTPFEEYQQDYPNDSFDVSNTTPEELAKWCNEVGDFLYIYRGLKGLSIMVANVDEIVHDIVNDLYSCNRIEPTHEVDYLFYSREREFIDQYVCVFKVIGTKDGDYYVVYQEDKWAVNRYSLREAKKLRNRRQDIIHEAINKVLRENIFNDQWEMEIEMFIDGVKNGKAIVDNGYVAVEFGNDETDPRYIYYKEGEDHLTDDHFSQQHSRRLCWDEISDIRDYVKYNYGIDIYIPDDEYYEEEMNFER